MKRLVLNIYQRFLKLSLKKRLLITYLCLSLLILAGHIRCLLSVLEKGHDQACLGFQSAAAWPNH